MSTDLRQYLEQLVRWQDEHHPKHIATVQRFLLKHGRSFAFDNKSFTEAGEQQMCYKNAAEAVLWDDADDLIYCEGMVDAIIPIDHAWLIDKNGKVIDPTLRNTGHINGYFGVPFKREFLRKTVLNNKRYGVFDWRHKDWVNADPKKMIAMIKEAA